MAKNKQKRILKNESGMSLIPIVIAMAIVAIMATITSQAARNMYHSARLIALQEEEEDLRNFIRSRLDCTETKKQMAAAGNSNNIILYTKLGVPLFPKRDNWMYFKKWHVSVKSYNAATGAFDVDVKNDDRPAVTKLFRYAALTCK